MPGFRRSPPSGRKGEIYTRPARVSSRSGAAAPPARPGGPRPEASGRPAFAGDVAPTPRGHAGAGCRANERPKTSHPPTLRERQGCRRVPRRRANGETAHCRPSPPGLSCRERGRPSEKQWTVRPHGATTHRMTCRTRALSDRRRRF
ncbi:Hypothetical Protein RSKD131_0310 [Cereibacter sphaeroides KD131]|nr:Hypothetical Protein RSKD131_0310 [Cereibacter sphaeroides KD131]